VQLVAGRAHDRHDLLDRGRVGRIADALVPPVRVLLAAPGRPGYRSVSEAVAVGEARRRSPPLPGMYKSSQRVAAAFSGCRSLSAFERAPADARSSSVSSVSRGKTRTRAPMRDRRTGRWRTSCFHTSGGQRRPAADPGAAGRSQVGRGQSAPSSQPLAARPRAGKRRSGAGVDGGCGWCWVGTRTRRSWGLSARQPRRPYASVYRGLVLLSSCL
jgi:hypothetical protein